MRLVKGLFTILVINIMFSILIAGGIDIFGIVLFTVLGLPLYLEQGE